MWRRLFGRWGKRSPAPEEPGRGGATPEEVIHLYFAAVAAHDLDAMVRTMAPERALLYKQAPALDRQRRTVEEARVIAVEPVESPGPLPALAAHYAESRILKVEYDLHLVEADRRRDPTLREGRQWAYYIVVSEGPGKPWLIADWGV